MQTTRLASIANNMSELIGDTPMVYLKFDEALKGRVALKLESENPMASIKDRLGLGIILEAERAGEITPSFFICMSIVFLLRKDETP